MQLRRPIAALVTALALFGGGATMTACGAPTTPNEGTTEDEGSGQQLSPEDADRENLPDSHDSGDGVEQGNGNDDSDDG
jgi:hypothetical protein